MYDKVGEQGKARMKRVGPRCRGVCPVKRARGDKGYPRKKPGRHVVMAQGTYTLVPWSAEQPSFAKTSVCDQNKKQSGQKAQKKKGPNTTKKHTVLRQGRTKSRVNS